MNLFSACKLALLRRVLLRLKSIMNHTIVHITTRAAWTEAQARGIYTAPSLEREGFIHFSTPEQVLAVADFLYRGRNGLVLLCVDPSRLSAELRYEALGTTEPYPHLYGTLELAAVTRVLDFFPEGDGSFRLPL